MEFRFLDIVAKSLYEQYGEQLSNLCLVFPSRRARLFFSQSLSYIIEKPIWQPSYSTMDELVKHSVSIPLSDKFPLLIALYESYQTIRKTEEPFDHFYFWGDIMLNDFDIIDKYRINAAALFTNLRHQKAFEGDFSFLGEDQLATIRNFWDNFHSDETTLQRRFMEIWDVLFPIYQDFRNRLLNKNMAYEGMLYRLLTEQLESGEALGTNIETGRYAFVGFNALNECEKTVFRYLQKQGRADFFWDYDDYYLNNAQQEAGLFLRENIREFPSRLSFTNYSSSFKEPKNITVIAAPSDTTQAKLVPDIVENTNAATDATTAVILADEQLLMPLLHALPAVTQNINISMGYPLKNSAIFSLIELVLKMQCNAKLDKNKGYRFYFNDLLAVLHHPYINLLDNNNINLEINKIVSYNNIYVTNLQFVENKSLRSLFEQVQNLGELSNKLMNLLDEIDKTATFTESEPMTQGYIHHCIRRLSIVKKAMDESRIEISLPVYANVLRNHLRSEKIPFSGEPLVGLQVLGLLEIRCLDFDNVIVLSANEGILPPSLDTPSFIPYNLRKGFGLPAIEQHEAIFAYQFYRVLQRAKHITLVYNTKTEDLKNGEASRYILQLKLESGHSLIEKNVSFNLGITEPEEIKVTKTPEIMEVLQVYFNPDNRKIFSPSALNTYISCPLRFYYRYVAQIKEPDIVEDELNNQLLGRILHASMENLYRPYTGKQLTANNLADMLASESILDATIDKSIANIRFNTDTMPPDALEDGRMIILKNVTKKYVRQILRIDKRVTPFIVEGLETRVAKPFTFATDGQPHTIQIGGIIDRMDRVGSSIRIVDYKTAAADAYKNKMPSISALFDSDEKKQRKELLQAMFYAVLLKQMQPTLKIQPLLYFLHDSFNEHVDFALIDTSTGAIIDDVEDYISPFMDSLQDTLCKIFDRHTPFVQTKDDKNCQYCPYKLLCNKV